MFRCGFCTAHPVLLHMCLLVRGHDDVHGLRRRVGAPHSGDAIRQLRHDRGQADVRVRPGKHRLHPLQRRVTTCPVRPQAACSGGEHSRPSKHETFSQCSYNVGTLSSTLAQHCTDIGCMFLVCWRVFFPNFEPSKMPLKLIKHFVVDAWEIK